MLVGTFYATMDPNGRILIPAKLRDTLNSLFPGPLILTYFDYCLLAYPMEVWNKKQSKFDELPSFDPLVVQCERQMYHYAHQCELDRAGRLLIPPVLRDKAKLEKEVVITGVRNRIEVWSKREWEAYQREVEDRFAQMAERMAALGF